MKAIKTRLVCYTSRGTRCANYICNSKKEAVEEGRWMIDNGFAFSYQTIPVTD